MSSLDPIPTTLSDQLRQLGLVHTASDLNDFIARATQKRWSPVVQLERLAWLDRGAARLTFQNLAEWQSTTTEHFPRIGQSRRKLVK